MKERLQKLMAQAGLGSRRDNEAIIAAGRVQVNGKVARLGDKADPALDTVDVDGSRLNLKSNTSIYVMLNKPKNVLSSLEDELGGERRTVRDLIDLPGHFYPVGRLDRQSEGLILMTNDGQMAHKLTHPRYAHEKVYRVVVEGRPSAQALEQWRQGVLLDGRPTLPVTIEVIQQQRAFTNLRIVMREGRKRQIRRIAALLGHPVRQLVREQIGTLELGDLKLGEWRYLTAEEIKALQHTIAAPALRTSPAPRAKPDGRRPYATPAKKGHFKPGRSSAAKERDRKGAKTKSKRRNS